MLIMTIPMMNIIPVMIMITLMVIISLMYMFILNTMSIERVPGCFERVMEGFLDC